MSTGETVNSSSWPGSSLAVGSDCKSNLGSKLRIEDVVHTKKFKNRRPLVYSLLKTPNFGAIIHIIHVRNLRKGQNQKAFPVHLLKLCKENSGTALGASLR